MSYRKKVIRRSKIKRCFIFCIIILISYIIYILGIPPNEKKYDKKILEMEELAEKLSIESTVDEGNIYYISESGTSSEGTNIEEPMSLEEANKKTFYGNDKILFKCGDTFYGQVNLKINASKNEMCYIGSYGAGEKPIISEAKILLNRDIFNELEGYENIYVVDISDENNFEGINDTGEKSCNIGFIRDQNNNIYGDRKESIDLLTDEMDFYCDNKRIYIKSEENPIDKYGKLVLAPNLVAVQMMSNTVLEGIKIMDTGGHGINKKQYPIKNVCIKNCVIENIGGSILGDSGTSRYGNAIEFYLDGENILIENNIIRNVYDVAITLQGSTGNWENIVIRDNIFINTCFSYEIWCREETEGINSLHIYNNMSINQGKGWGQEVRPNPYNSAELTIYTYNAEIMDINMYNNKYYNSTRLYYVLYSIKDKFKENVNIDNNEYFIEQDVYLVNDNKSEILKEYLHSEYNIDENSNFRVISDLEQKQINNKKILESDNYNQIKSYYENLEKEFAYTDSINKIAEKYVEFEEKYNQQLSNIEGLQEQVNTIKENIQSTNMSTDKEYIIQQLEQTYKIGTKLINNNCEYLENMLKSIEEIGKSYKEIINTENNTETEVDTSDIENQFIALNNLLEDNNDLDIEFVLELKSLLTEYYNNIQTTQGYEKEYNYISAKYLIEYANIILNNKITEYIENNPVTVSYSTTSLTNQDVTVTLNIPQDVKITNNEGSNTYTFTENGTFTFEYERRGKKDSEIVSVNYIDKTSPEITNVENGEVYTQSVSPNVSDEHLDKVQLTFKGQVIEDYEIGDELTEEGEYKLTATDTAGNTSTVKFYIMKEDSTYKINSSYILNINPETTTKSFMENFTIIKGYKIKNEDTELGEEDKISTGDILEDEDGTKFILVVKGDLNRDGRLSLIDLSIGRKYLLGIIDIDEVQKLSSDMNTDEETSLMDLSIMRKTLIGILQ